MNSSLWRCFRGRKNDHFAYKTTRTLEDNESGFCSSMSTIEEDNKSFHSLPNPSVSGFEKTDDRLTRSVEDIAAENGHRSSISTFFNPLFDCPPILIKRKIRLILIGSHEVGKSCLALRFLHNTFISRYNRTAESVKSVMRRFDGDHYYIEIIDLGAQLAADYNSYSRLAEIDGAIFVYSINDESSLRDVMSMTSIIKYTQRKQIPSVVLGNKSDLHRRISPSLGQQSARKMGSSFAEVSAKNGSGVVECFSELLSRVIKSIPEERNEYHITR